MTDKKVLDDLIEAMVRLSHTFKMHGLEPPISIQVDRRTHDRIKMLRGTGLDWIYSDAKDAIQVRIAGIIFERTDRSRN